ncbi:SDR family NAD(P)-dependent oxidoreductase [Jatrophihabitans sp.]|uniref:SDR family NAD(P)-dependent oxidoreductase n=1 Tax=Jatrophihabitans sp. TaxID=1932789 RepID=UPI0030C6DA97|nr:putative short chain dehydrogenase [Jatrophihabitans sp.]
MKDALGRVDSVVLLGGRSDIGLAVVTKLVAAGARRVVLAARGPADDAVAALLAAGATSVDTVEFDALAVSSHAGVVDSIFDKLGDVDVVVSAFAVQSAQEVYDASPTAAADAVTVNLSAQISTGLAVATRLRAQGHGTLVLLSSIAGVRVRPANLVYGATKAGLDAFGVTLHDMLAGSGAGVLVVRPGFVSTKLTEGLPTAPFATTPEAVADAVVGALAAGKRVVWVPRVVGVVAAVFRVLPRPVWRKISA